MEKKEIRWLKIVFSDDERGKMGIDLARKHGELAQAELDKKAAAKQMDERIARLEADVSSLSRKVADGFEFGNVDCTAIYNFTGSLYTCVRLDIGEIIEERPLTDAEKQLSLAISEA